MEVEELIGRRDALKAELLELEQAIARHPSTIKGAFAHNPLWDIDKFEELINKVSFIRWTKGQVDTNKSPVPWEGYVLQFDGTVYYLRKGRNWCESVFDYGPKGKEEPVDRKVVEVLWDQDDPVTYLTELGFEDWKMIGYLLTLNLDG